MSIDDIKYVLETFQSVFQNAMADINFFWKTIPEAFKVLIAIVVFVASINIIASLLKAIVINIKTWKKDAMSNLMFSFSAASGQFQRKHIYKEAHKLLFNRKWSTFSLASLAYKFGNLEHNSKTLLFLSSFLYLIISLLGATEMIIRCIAGVLILFVLNFMYFIFLLILWCVNLILMPMFKLVDRFSCITQHCPKCYTKFILPVFECPYCGVTHIKLNPGKHGLFFAKCKCGHFIPCNSAMKRKNLKSHCPKCDYPLVSSNVDALTIQVVGGNLSGKTAFISAFQHQYIYAINNHDIPNISTFPKNSFDELEKMYNSGKTHKSSADKIGVYHILHGNKSRSDNGVIIYDVPDEIIRSEEYEKNPLNFAFSDGIIIIIDPLSISSVREECKIDTQLHEDNLFSNDSSDDVIVSFINKYSEVTGRRSRRMSNIPVAVIISKTDLYPIGKSIGITKVRSEYNANSDYSNIREACDKMCRKYLSSIGLANTINNLESVFSHVSYFPVSAIGHNENGCPFTPNNVIAPVMWIASQCQSKIGKLNVFDEEEII